MFTSSMASFGVWLFLCVLDPFILPCDSGQVKPQLDARRIAATYCGQNHLALVPKSSISLLHEVLRVPASGSQYRTPMWGLTVQLRGGAESDAGCEEDSAAQREAAMLEDMGLTPVKDGDELTLFDAEGRKFAPAARTVPGELWSDDELSNLSEPGCHALDPGDNEATADQDECDPEYANVVADVPTAGTAQLMSTVRIKYYDLANGATVNISDAFPDQPAISGMWQVKFDEVLKFDLCRNTSPGRIVWNLFISRVLTFWCRVGPSVATRVYSHDHMAAVRSRACARILLLRPSRHHHI